MIDKIGTRERMKSQQQPVMAAMVETTTQELKAMWKTVMVLEMNDPRRVVLVLAVV
jgi:hypothetical protein